MSKKRLLWAGIVVATIGIVGAVVFIVWQKNNSATEPSGPLTAQTVAKPPETAELDAIKGSYNQQKYDQVIVASKKYVESTAKDASHKLYALSLCLDSAVKISDLPAKDYCYSGAKTLLDTEQDDIIKTEMTKKLDSLYSGADITAGVADDGISQ